jgi:hypothetical protein
MTVRQPVKDFVKLGPLPDSSVPEEKIALHEVFLMRIQKPVTDEEARLLSKCFGPDECYGGAWTLLHLIESAPNGAPVEHFTEQDLENEWVRFLKERRERAG